MCVRIDTSVSFGVTCTTCLDVLRISWRSVYYFVRGSNHIFTSGFESSFVTLNCLAVLLVFADVMFPISVNLSEISLVWILQNVTPDT